MNGRQSVDVVVLGAGAAGLAAAVELSRTGLHVAVLEARDRIGGRVHTLHDPAYTLPVELGAEFVHGRPSEILELVQRSDLALMDAEGRHRHWYAGALQVTDFWRELESVFRHISDLSTDISFASFIRANENAASDLARDLAWAFVEGFYAADAERVSLESLSSFNPDDSRVSRLVGGYDGAIRLLAGQLSPEQVSVQLRTVVERVEWSPSSVMVSARTPDGRTRPNIVARAGVITLPVGVLKAAAGEPGAVAFDPELRQHRDALDGLEMGSVVKIVLRFSDAFWEHEKIPTAGEPLHDTAFMHAHPERAPFPTWWSLYPMRSRVLVGWAGGTAAQRLGGKSEAEVLDAARTSLETLLGLSPDRFDALLESATIADWQSDPFSRGAYAYSLVGAADAMKRLREPLAGTLFFAGEATHSEQSGTVPGAIASGRRAAAEIIEQLSV